ncbi:MAG: putative molybdopterin cofactor synthesis protein [Ilumatobacteraceae bacterium]|nr:putative molybdopterin cofactor synthesis protein [Ilumatobacteraceae bacterium]
MPQPVDASEPRPEAVSRPRRPLPVRLARYALRELQPAIDATEAGARAVARRAGSPHPRHPGWEEGRDLERHWQWSACYAPLTSMYLDQFGKVRACCQNTEHLLGDITTSTLREIWDGEATSELRRALARSDLGKGCQYCKWQLDEGNRTGALLRSYDDPIPIGWSRKPEWPRYLEFSITNTCNLQCVMCNGDWSSSIRSQREQRPPLPAVYGEAFFEQLGAFIPHLKAARFTGGEPFLGREPLRIMDLVVDHGAEDAEISVVTNGTTFNAKVERILTTVQPQITVSLDGGTAEVYERVRLGASFDKVMANLDRFQAIVDGWRPLQATLNLTHCLMVDNWSTFPELLFLAEERDLDVAVNNVRFPEAHSLYHLPQAELAEIVTALEARTAEVERLVTGNRLALWHQQLAALANRARSDSWPAALGVEHQQLVDTSVVATPVSLGPTRRS